MTRLDCTTPVALMEGRMRALERGDFSLIYDSYHRQAPFLGHFSDKAEYLDFADRQLRGIALTGWRILRRRERAGGEVEILLWMRIGTGPAAQDLFELARLIDTEHGWRYHSAQKLTREDYPGPAELIDFEHFDQAALKIRF